MIKNFFYTSKESLILAIGWLFVLVIMIMEIVAGKEPTWTGSICAVTCCVIYNLTEFLRRKGYD